MLFIVILMIIYYYKLKLFIYLFTELSYDLENISNIVLDNKLIALL